MRRYDISFILIFFIISFSQLGIAQSNTQTIRGNVIDKDNQQALIGVNISLTGTEIGTTSDTNGNFRLEEILVGRYQIQFSYLGYQTILIPEILLEAGKELVLNIQLQESSKELETVEVRASSTALHRNDVPLGIHTLSIEETRRFPANFNDPVRLAVSLPGVVSDNDQANGISIRGNSPAGMAWRLEGVEIVNPNHLSNAGTFSDRPTASGGGVNILSAQLLGNSNFLKGASPVSFGNALSGTMDMHLRKGNDEQREYTVELGLLGVDLAAEGPFSKSSKASYLINYRYSFVGILDALGVQLGDEAISFQDLSFNANFPLKKGSFNIFGVGGISKNEFTAQRDTSLWEFQKDNQDILFENQMGTVGANLKLALNQRLAWTSSLVFSTVDTERRSDLIRDDLTKVPLFENDILKYQKLGFNTDFSFKANPSNKFKFGANATYHNFNNFSILNFFETVAAGDFDGILFQPYGNWQFQKGTFTSNVGLQYSHFTLNGSDALEPRASVKWDFRPKQFLALAYGLQSQLQRPQVYTANVSEFQNRELGLSKAHHVSLGYTNYLSNTTKLSLEAYYQHLFDIPIVNEANRSYSTLNLVEAWVDEVLENEGTGTNYGIEASLQRYIQGDFYYLVNATLYRSLYVGGDGIERSTRFDGRYILNATLGKEWSKTKKGKDKTWGVNARITNLGGFRESPIDLVATQSSGYTRFDETQAFSLDGSSYFKVDMRFYFRRSKGKRSSTLALDLQNATNQENVAYSYYDFQQEAIVVRNQLGLIPNLSYRIQF